MQISGERSPPNEVRHFFHKRVLGAVKGFIEGGPLGAASGFIRGGRGVVRTQPAPVVFTAPRAPRRAAPAPAVVTQPPRVRPSRQELVFGTGTALELSSTIARELAGAGGLGCSPGFARDSKGNCVSEATLRPGIRQFLSSRIPGGSSGIRAPASIRRAPSAAGAAVVGAFGMPALEPMEVGTITRNDGSVGPLLRCAGGFVLGTDELCYPREILRRNSRFRKWRPGLRPILTGGQRSSIRKAKTAITTARDAISGLGVSVTKK